MMHRYRVPIGETTLVALTLAAMGFALIVHCLAP